MRIGETFQKAGLITEAELDQVLDEQKSSHDRLGDIVLRMGFATPETIAPVLANYFHIPFINLKDIYKSLDSSVIDSVSEQLARRFNSIPVELKNGTLIVAMFDPLNLLAIDTMRIKTGRKIQCVIAPETDIQEAINYCYNEMPRMKQHIDDFIVDSSSDPDSASRDDNASFEASDQPVVQFVRSLIVQAVNSRASDIHLQPKQDAAELRYRIDGVLYSIDPPPKTMMAAISTRIKILAGLDIAEKRLPQDGRFKIRFDRREVDIRTSCFPTIYGESVVMRLLDTSAPMLGMEQLGFDSGDLATFQEMITQPYGMVLVTGPTGSGKTTTLYTALHAIQSSDKNIITLEDPVEYRLAGIQQSQVNSGIGFDFARGLRSILRQDPDVIMVGEIRDRETAEIAIHAALTGHLVFTTLHTNDAAGAPVRLTKMGIEPFLITSSLLGVIAQRLIRKICPHCRSGISDDLDIRRQLGVNGEITQFFRGQGCGECLNSGYQGRLGTYELMRPDEKIRELVLNQRSSEQIRQAAQANGMRTLRQSAMEHLKKGVTTPEEVLRVTRESQE